MCLQVQETAELGYKIQSLSIGVAREVLNDKFIENIKENSDKFIL